LNQIAGAQEIQLKRHKTTTALAGGFFLKIISLKDRVFNHIVHPTFSQSTKKEKMSKWSIKYTIAQLLL